MIKEKGRPLSEKKAILPENNELKNKLLTSSFIPICVKTQIISELFIVPGIYYYEIMYILELHLKTFY